MSSAAARTCAAVYSGVPVARAPDHDLRHERHRRGAGGHPVHRAAGRRPRPAPATGFELDIITIVLLGGVSIFGGSGSMLGVVLSTFLVLNIRNGMSLAGVTGNTQTGVVGLLLILSVLCPTSSTRYQDRRAAARRTRRPGQRQAPRGRRRPRRTAAA